MKPFLWKRANAIEGLANGDKKDVDDKVYRILHIRIYRGTIGVTNVHQIFSRVNQWTHQYSHCVRVGVLHVAVMFDHYSWPCSSNDDVTAAGSAAEARVEAAAVVADCINDPS